MPELTDRTAVDEDVVALIRKTMSDHVGVARDGPGLRKALEVFEALHNRPLMPRLANMALVARCIAAAAFAREESRGGHMRLDFPDTSEAWHHRTFLTLEDVDAIVASALPQAA